MVIETLINEVLRREGGYVNHPSDRGGPTKYGITQRTLAAWRGHAVTAKDVEDLTIEEAINIYRSFYWDKPGFNSLSGLHPLVAEMLFDAGVNHGPKAAIRMLQRAAGTELDEIIGPKTRSAVMKKTARDLAARFIAERVIEYGRIISENNTQAVFAHGWMKRAAEFISKLGGMV